MSCRSSVCAECATEWDGINHCVTCLAARRKQEWRGTGLLGPLLALLASIALFALAVELMVWCGALVGGLVRA